jgi:hypothetical protein
MVNGAIPIIAMARNGLGCDQRAETRYADGPDADHSKQTITRSVLVSHDLQKSRNYQFMNAHRGGADLESGMNQDLMCSVSAPLAAFPRDSRQGGLKSVRDGAIGWGLAPEGGGG